MNWLFVGILLGSAVSSQHETREACEGRAVLLKEKGVIGQCYETPQYNYSNTLTVTPGITFGVGPAK